MKEYQLGFGWKISFPEKWVYEYHEGSKQNIFCTPGSDLIIRINAFHLDRYGEPVPIEAMENAYTHTISTYTEPFNVDEYKLSGFSIKGFAYEVSEDDKMVFRKSVGYYAPGELLSVNIAASSEDECKSALEFLHSLSFDK